MKKEKKKNRKREGKEKKKRIKREEKEKKGEKRRKILVLAINDYGMVAAWVFIALGEPRIIFGI